MGCQSSPPTPRYNEMGLEGLFSDEHLIRWGWPEDVWFHVDKLSSAHVYLRLLPGQTIHDIPKEVLDDAAQLVKANSIQGNKMNDIDVVYTMWSNLKKTDGMEAGQVYKMRVAKRINEIVNRLNKTKREGQPDLQAEREEHDRKEREINKRLMREQKEREKEEERRKKEEAELRELCKNSAPPEDSEDDGDE
uniref:Coiled-coil domain-containing protein 25 n=1 Tax=Timema cristinae TaxID=61476 RepID=A0A7R9GRE6_TIMCR|nr:unnamed protein product [Timema cristinae]